MNKIEINPKIKSFVVFSGGGGLITRKIILNLNKGINEITVNDVPASFDPDTFVVDFNSDKIKLQEFVIKKPNRKYVDDNLKREGNCAERLISESIELGTMRPKILEICENVSNRTYIDEEVYLVIIAEAEADIEISLAISYFIDDARFKWKPTIIVELDENWENCKVKGFIAISNESANRFDEVDVSFADFAKDMNEDTSNTRLEPREFKVKMKQQRMKMMKIK